MNAIIAAQPRDFLHGRAAAQARPRVSIIVPTYREAENVAPTVAAIERALGDIAWEIIFVDDDSPDGTVAAVRSLGERDGRVRVIRRVGRRGLAGAVIEGMMASAADIVAVIDADLQHDEALLPKMLGAIETGNADLVIATRYAQSGDAQGGFSTLRRNASTLATRVSNLLLKTNVSDPMSGFFMIRRDAIDGIAPNLATGGFKLLLDILASAPESLKIVEMPYQFRPRQLGTSKLDALVIADFLGLLLSKLSGNTISPRFFLFALVGATGLVVHLATLRSVLTTTHIPFNAAQFIAALVAMTSNFFLNNALTFRDRRLTGSAVFKGLLTFYLVCSIGTLANVGVAELIYLRDASWWRAGIAGAVMAAVFNYAVSSMLTWRK
ncbi:Dolichyl-phosphate beta-D-mannosyltransferase [Hyphomicrobium denitrificans ATCC 51888]|uniref:Dolichyl-phosphate beta-D-mannosyltransferase n=1 Tax=Hyphomicrobium denitrificans (strain ATCC 51888 / DSM 1869 / NCIMB 11706 / TK 0415) TaxID=582899 RepID=D8JQD9_HYPDA|nr:glycosyltransferase family 2 protein [Hyphomicrobium denitrificans]ADJ23893.1 Dolichyl-phosphate beta-D-mannosyltransferase [Hyphomicrobium denitrificans ATCC 51888]